MQKAKSCWRDFLKGDHFIVYVVDNSLQGKSIRCKKKSIGAKKVDWLQKKSIGCKKNPLGAKKNPLGAKKIHWVQKKSIGCKKNPLVARGGVAQLQRKLHRCCPANQLGTPSIVHRQTSLVRKCQCHRFRSVYPSRRQPLLSNPRFHQLFPSSPICKHCPVFRQFSIFG